MSYSLAKNLEQGFRPSPTGKQLFTVHNIVCEGGQICLYQLLTMWNASVKGLVITGPYNLTWDCHIGPYLY